MYCSTCQATQLSFTLWQPTEGVGVGFFFVCVNNIKLHSLQNPAVRVVLCQGACSSGRHTTAGQCLRHLWLSRALWTLEEGKLSCCRDVCAALGFPVRRGAGVAGTVARRSMDSKWRLA